MCAQSPRLRFHCRFYLDSCNILSWRDLGWEENLLSLWYADFWTFWVAFSMHSSAWSRWWQWVKRVVEEGEIAGEKQRGSLVSPSSLLSPACTTVFLQLGAVNVLFAGLHCYQPAKVCEEASQTYIVFVLHFPHHAPSNRSLLPPWKLLLILITLLLGTCSSKWHSSKKHSTGLLKGQSTSVM